MCHLAIAVSLVAALPAAVQDVTRQYQPFTAKTLITYIDETDSTTEFNAVFARKTNGSYARLEQTEDYAGERGSSQYIADFIHKTWTTIKSYTQSATIFAMDDREFSNFQDLPGSCKNLTDGSWNPIGESQLLGFNVTEVERKISAKLTEKLWVAPQLQCFPLQELFIEGGRVISKQEVTELSMGNPDPELFSIPRQYALVSPVEFEARWKEKFKGRSYLGEEQARRREARYQQFIQSTLR